MTDPLPADRRAASRRPYADVVTTAPNRVSDTVAAITARLTARHDGLTILRAVTDACADLLSADATGVLVRDPRGGVAVGSASDERARFVELLQVQFDQGPCLDSINNNTQVSSPDLDADRSRWPEFVDAALTAGYRSLYAFPLRLVSRAVGGINLLYRSRTELSTTTVDLGQALADLAVLGLTQERDERRIERLAEQTLTTLNDRIHIGQAVGILAGALDLTPDDARALLAEYAKATGRSVRELARAITDGSLPPATLTPTS
jgi:GAF domain-containing protein